METQSSTMQVDKTQSVGESSRIESLERRLEGVVDRIRLKDEHIATLQEANRALVEQFRSRWTGPQLAMSAMTAVFVLTFGYQLVKATELERIHAQSESALDALQAVGKELVDGTQSQANILASLAEAIELTSQGQRRINQGRVTEGLIEVQRALEAVKRGNAILDDLKKKDRGRKSDTNSRNREGIALVAADLALPLEQAIRDAEFFAQGTLATGRFENGDYTLVAAVGSTLIELDSKRWEGYHFRALGTGHAGGDLRASIVDYEHSVQLKNQVNIDNLNLAEVYFVTGDYDKASQAAQRYLGADAHPPATLKKVAELYAAASRRGKGHMSHEEFEKVLAGMASFQVNKDVWSWDLLREFTRKPMPHRFEEHKTSIERLFQPKAD